jgi:phage/conjugal plasmid C-4 type zinc finger TraR family protein
MADEVDIANDYAQRMLDGALQQRAIRPVRASAQFCADCDDPIPSLRRQLVQGCDTCVDCQGLRERRK